jgi:hypothetical protein
MGRVKVHLMTEYRVLFPIFPPPHQNLKQSVCVTRKDQKIPKNRWMLFTRESRW